MITEKSIRDRLAIKDSRLPTWEEIEYLLNQVSDLRDAIREAGADLRLMEESLARCESERERSSWL